jgi:hypothetical protein
MAIGSGFVVCQICHRFFVSSHSLPYFVRGACGLYTNTDRAPSATSGKALKFTTRREMKTFEHVQLFPLTNTLLLKAVTFSDRLMH